MEMVFEIGKEIVTKSVQLLGLITKNLFQDVSREKNVNIAGELWN
ncbi:8951_t:CDS:2 [Diversispora eburnea]|uniref:8951_t:CDS:1 n=1 Tax=Diversispora eburnea TaxID=1213867 RepID=A0A9N9ALZ4_9GLOM|nr:8951_t:CDS:2 [Diversispora eburnea]